MISAFQKTEGPSVLAGQSVRMRWLAWPHFSTYYQNFQLTWTVQHSSMFFLWCLRQPMKCF